MRSHPEGPRAEGSTGRGSTALLIGVLALLAVIPVGSTVWLSRVEREVTEVLEPARRVAEELAMIHARQMLYFQEYLLTGSFEAENRYRDLLREEARVSDELRTRVEDAAIDVRALHLPVVTAAITWQLGHVEAFSDRGRRTWIEGPAVEADQRRFEDLLDAASALQNELDARSRAARARIARTRDRLLLVTLGLIGVALLGTVLVGALSRRLRGLVEDARERQAEALRVRRELDAVFDATADALLEVDADGRILRINPATTRLLGWSEEDARGESIERLLLGAPDRRGEIPDIVDAVRRRREVDGEEGEIRTRRGRTIPVLWSTRRLTEGGVGRGVVVTLTDLTEIQQTTEALRRAVKAREETLAVVSHDLRSPLSTVQAVGELLLEVPVDDEKRQAHLTNLLRAAGRMNHLIRDLLDIARIDAGVLSVRAVEVGVPELLQAARDALVERTERAGIELLTRDEVPDIRVAADADRVLQVWENLVGNALRHAGGGGRIELAARPRSDVVEFSVSDSGSGIPEDELPHLFDRFWRADLPRRDGAGLGLAIVRGIVEAHGGEVGVENLERGGARFHFTLPRAPTPSTRGDPRPDSS
ncbi:MAG: ATP-binding protein [Longimicrobiales bacterium]|nr:ATP-binding protein [Longimicrobiales bacterium]